MNRWSVFVFALLPVAGASLNFPVQRYALRHGFLPLGFTAPRFALGAALFAAVSWLRERLFRTSRRDLAALIGIGIFGIALNQIALAYAPRHCSATTLALLLGTLPVFVMLLLSERLSTLQALGGFVIAAGIRLSWNAPPLGMQAAEVEAPARA